MVVFTYESCLILYFYLLGIFKLLSTSPRISPILLCCPFYWQHTFLWRAYRAFSRTNHMVGHKTSLSECKNIVIISSIFFNHDTLLSLIMSDSLWAHGLQYTRLPCPSPSPRVCSDSHPCNQWYHLSHPLSPSSQLYGSRNQIQERKLQNSQANGG